jgi:hypothetical protein
MPTTTISTSDIRDAAVTSPKLASNISIENLTITAAAVKIPTASSYISITNDASTPVLRGIAVSNLLVGSDTSDWTSVPIDSQNRQTGNAYFEGNVIVNGDFTVKGSTVSMTAETVSVADNIMLLNSNVTGAPSEDAGIEIGRGASANALLLWDETNDYWKVAERSGGTIANSNRLVTGVYAGTLEVTTNTGADKFIVSRNHKTANFEEMRMWLDDGNAYFHYINDETDSKIIFQLENTDTEAGSGVKANTGYISMTQSIDLGTRLGIGTATPTAALDVAGGGKISTTLTVGTGFTLTSGNITLADNATVDGVDISAHAAAPHLTQDEKNALAGTNGTPSSSNKYVTNSDTRLSDARTPTTHGDSYHNALAYFDTVTDGTTSKSATSSKQNIKFAGAGSAAVAVTSDATYDAIVTVTGTNTYVSSVSGGASGTVTFTRNDASTFTWDASHNHDSVYVKLDPGTGKTQTIARDVAFSNNITISGNLTVSGTTTTVNTATLNIADNMITLNSDYTGDASTDPGAESAGMEVERGSAANVSLLWDEASDYWKLTNDGTSFSRIIDQTYGDGRYMAKTNKAFSGQVTITSTSDSPLVLNRTGGGWNYLQFMSDKASSGTYVRKAYIGMESDDSTLAISSEGAGASIKLYNNVTVTGNISMSASATVDGRDVSADGSKLDTLESIRGKRGRKAALITATVEQDIAHTMAELGLSGVSWTSNNILFVIVDGQINTEDVGAAQFDYSKDDANQKITFHYDIPTESIIEIVVL